jgi:hypothetical protein
VYETLNTSAKYISWERDLKGDIQSARWIFEVEGISAFDKFKISCKKWSMELLHESVQNYLNIKLLHLILSNVFLLLISV